ncbi:HalOD1 output domain-containing protein [Halopelagius fulvigenes]|uniref:HalOD1 output domain-containing protein n=1 Tax=Halopelagius fulvigenes TaxID=1198324 RepID=A0ABD5U6C4_9EURY
MNPPGDSSRGPGDSSQEMHGDSASEPASTPLPVDSVDSATGLTYHDATATYRMEYDLSADAPQEVVVRAVAALEGCSPLDLEPLHAAIDPDALDRLFAPTNVGRHLGDGTVTFGYQGYEVTLHSYGVIALRPAGGRPEDD